MTHPIPILLFDGVCNLCNSMVRFVIKHDKKRKIMFAALQSEKGNALLKKYSLPTKENDSFVFIVGEKYFQKSTAALMVLREMGGGWKILYALIIVPSPIRNLVYDIVAKSRYRIFGKRDECMIPGNDIKDRFVT